MKKVNKKIVERMAMIYEAKKLTCDTEELKYPIVLKHLFNFLILL
jgi:hypothetical protein